MIKLQMPTKDIPSDPANLSPALAAMVASLMIPHQYSKFVQVTVESLNSQCKSRMKYIGK